LSRLRKGVRMPHKDLESDQNLPRPAKGVILIGCLLLWLSLLFAGPAQYRPTYAIGPSQPFVFHEDPQGSMSLEAFLALPPSSLALSEGPLMQGYTRAAL